MPMRCSTTVPVARRSTSSTVGWTELTWPELAIRRVRVSERDLLVLAGPEPDDRWQAFRDAVVEIAHRLGVVEWISLGAIPAAVPHTRSVPILGTTSEAGRLRGDVRPGPAGLLRVPAATVSVLEMAMAEGGIPAVGYFAQVPHYVSGPYPRRVGRAAHGPRAPPGRRAPRAATWPRRRSSCATAWTPRPPSRRPPGTTSSGSRGWWTTSDSRPAMT